MFDTLRQDTRHALRRLRNEPKFAAVSAFSLALGIGANTAIFSLIDALMLKTLPVSRPEELLQVNMGGDQGYFSNPVWEQIRNRQDAFPAVFAYSRWQFNLAAGGEVRNVNGVYASGELFETLGVPAALGRTFTSADDHRGWPGGAVLGYGFWQREYGGSRAILGRTISLNGHPIPIWGVTARGFTGTEVGASFDVIVPLCAEAILHGDTSLLDASPAGGWLRIIGRTRPGDSASQVAARLKGLAPPVFRATVPPEWPAEDRAKWLRRTLETRTAASGLSYLREEYRRALLILIAVAGAVLLIACANVSSLLLARGAARRREIAIRAALGSGRVRLLQQLLTESLLLSFIGAAPGILFAVWGNRFLIGFLDVSLDLMPDLRVLGFTTGIAILTGILFGLAPAWRASRTDPAAALKASRGGTGGSRAGKLMVMAQVALSLALVSVAGLLLSTFWRLSWMHPGFDRDRVLLVSLDLRGTNYSPVRRTAVFRQILDSVRTQPGVRTASLSDFTPITPNRRIHEVAIDGYTASSRADAEVYFNAVSDGYFSSMGIGLVAGRDFDGHDTLASPAVAIVNQTLVQKRFRGANPIGKRFRIRSGDRFGAPVEIVGVVKDAKFNELRQEIPATAYTPLSQTEKPFPFSNLEVRVAGGAPAALIGPVRDTIASVDRTPSIEFTTLAAQVGKSLEREQLLAKLAGFFGGLALLLAAMGLYGVMSYHVARRRGEIGIRMALGAPNSRVLRMVMGEVAVLIGAGLAAGLAVTLASTRLVTSFLYGMRANDPLTLALAAAILAITAAMAGFGPARRASRLDPMAVLREE